MSLEISEAERRGQHVISVSGEVDLYTSPTLRQALLSAIERWRRVGVDLSRVAYMDSSGVATLVEGYKLAQASDHQMSILQPSEQVLKVLKLARLDSIFTIEVDSAT